MKLVLIESPFAGEVEANIEYAKLCVLDSIKRGEAPFASHLFYPLVLDDLDKDQRANGIRAGLYWGKKADVTAVYTDRGISGGMQMGIDHAKKHARRIEYRTIRGYKK